MFACFLKAEGEIMILVLLGICVIMLAVSVILLINDMLDDETCLCGIVAFGMILLFCVVALI